MIIVMTMVTVSKSALKARMLEFFREVERTGEELVVTSDGVPVLKVVPFSQTRSVGDAFADVRGHLTWTGDIDAPTDAEWPAP
jgi:prevent-host-death family protein